MGDSILLSSSDSCFATSESNLILKSSASNITFSDKGILELFCNTSNAQSWHIGIVPSTWWSFEEVGHNDEAVKETNFLIGKKVFSTPKPIRLLNRILQLSTSKDNEDIVLDFFSGSSATAHAVMQLNAEDGGNRRFIMVQLPEPCDEKSEAYKAGYKNICEIGKERIRRAGKQLTGNREQLTGNSEQVTINGEQGIGGSSRKTVTCNLLPVTYNLSPVTSPDFGFKVFKLDTSNLKTWDSTPIEEEQLSLLYQRMNQMIHRVKPDRTDLDMVYEIMLKLGVPLIYPVTKIQLTVNREQVTVGDKPVNCSLLPVTCYTVGEDCLLLICLVGNVQPEDVEAMVEYAPAKIIISRDSFADDTAMSNAYYILRDKEIELKLV